MKTKILLLPFLFILILSSVVLVKAQDSTSLTITTDKQTTYDMYDPITLSGSLESNGFSPSDGLVGIQIQEPSGGSPTVLRTVETGTQTVFNMPVAITSAYSSDLGGDRVGVVQSGNNAYVTAVLSDQDNQAHTLLYAFSIYDSNGVPLGLESSTISLGAQATQSATVSIQIPTWAHAGIAYGYADVYSDLPQNGGVPLAQEQPFQFTISGGTPSSGSAPSTSGGSGAYSLSFKLPKTCSSGTYQVYASSIYSGYYGTASTSFNVQLLGDFNGDGKVDANDLFIFLNSYITYYQGQGFTPACDLNNDGKVNANDFFLFLNDYIQYWSP